MNDMKILNMDIRLKLKDLLISMSESTIKVKAVLTLQDVVFEGLIETATSSNINWLVARAVLNAIISYLNNKELVFNIEGIKLITMAEKNVMMVLVNMQSNSVDEAFVGTCIIRKNEADAVARATLDALNRKIALLSTNNLPK